jgi:hypothetical protein
MKRTSRLILLWIFSALATVCLAREIITVGSAPIRNGDVGQARDLAFRRALARAAESESATVHSQSVVRPGVVSESTQLRTSACTGKSQVVSETVTDSELTMTLAVSVLSQGDCPAICQSSYVNKVIITDFRFEFPEQLYASEKENLKYKTAGEVARSIRKGKRLLVDFDAMNFPYLSPDLAPESSMRKTESETPFSKIARSQRGQYVVSGVYRDIGIRIDRWNRQFRRIEVEAFLHDGANGALLDRGTFVSEAPGVVVLSESIPLGSPGFYQSDFGKVWGEVLGKVARWTEEKVTCLPFIARVIKIDGDLVYIDAGAESGLTAGDTLNLHAWRKKDVRNIDNMHLGVEKYFLTSASLKSIYPQFSILQLVQKLNSPQSVNVGDLAYSQ